jgi:hypothetical protein
MHFVAPPAVMPGRCLYLWLYVRAQTCPKPIGRQRPGLTHYAVSGENTCFLLALTYLGSYRNLITVHLTSNLNKAPYNMKLQPLPWFGFVVRFHLILLPDKC